MKYSPQLRTNIMFCFIFAIFCCLQSYTFGVSLQPRLAEIGLWTTQSSFFTCTPDKSENDGTLKWINPKGMEIDDNSRAPIHVGPDMGPMGVKIFFRNPNKDDSGEYKCQFQKEGRALSTLSLRLHVYKAIDMRGNKESFVGQQGDTFTMTCITKFDTSGTDSQTTWWFNNHMITSGVGQYSTEIKRNEGNGQLILKNILTIKDLAKENEGIYTCKAVTSNQHLSDMKDLEMNLRVQFGPNFPVNTPQYVWISDNIEGSPIIVNITCIVNADPVVKFRWFTGDDVAIDRGVLKSKAKVSPVTENLSILSLEYKNLDEIRRKDHRDPVGNMKKFICEVQNRLGTARNVYELKVGKLPDSPIIHSHEYNDGLLSLSLNESNTDPPIDKYRIEIADKTFVYFNDSYKNAVNNTYEIPVNLPKGDRKSVV